MKEGGKLRERIFSELHEIALDEARRIHQEILVYAAEKKISILWQGDVIVMKQMRFCSGLPSLSFEEFSAEVREAQTEKMSDTERNVTKATAN